MKDMTLACTFKIDDSYDNEKFIRMRAKIMHSSVNPNRSNFEKNIIEAAEPSIYNTPVLANVIIDGDGNVDFGAHDFHFEDSKTQDGDTRLIYDEQPLGVIIESCNYEVVNEGGIYYVYADLYLFKPYLNYAIDVLDNNDEIKLSMEIYIDKYKHNNSTGITDILAYRYKGITLLGAKFGTGMRGAKAEQYALEDSKQKMFDMMTELRFALNQQSTLIGDDIDNYKEGGTGLLDEKIMILQKYNVTAKDVDFEMDSLSIEDLESKLIEFTKKKENCDGIPEDEKKEGEFELNLLAKIDEIQTLLSEQTFDHPYWGAMSKYWLVDIQNDEVIVYNVADNFRYYGIKYQENGDAVSLDFDNAKRKKVKFEDFVDTNASNEYFKNSIESIFGLMENKTENIKKDFEKYKEKFSVSVEDFNSLKEFKENVERSQREEAEKEVFEKFDAKLIDIEEYKKLKEIASEYEIDALEKECFSILGRKTANFTLNVNVKNKNQIKVPVDNVLVLDDAYGGLFAKYGKKPLNKD